MIGSVFASFLVLVEAPETGGTPGVARVLPGYAYLHWEAAPTTAEIAAVKPNTPSRGVVVYTCGIRAAGTLTNCKLDGEDPSGSGFGKASTSLLPKFRLGKQDAKSVRSGSGLVEVKIGFGGSVGCFPPYCTVVPPAPPPPPKP